MNLWLLFGGGFCCGSALVGVVTIAIAFLAPWRDEAMEFPE